MCPQLSWAQFQGAEFVENKGQWPSDVRFMAKEGAAKLWLGDSSFLVQLTDYSDLEAAHHHQQVKDNPSIKHALIKVQFLGVGTDVLFFVKGASGHQYNFFLGKDQTRWAKGVKGYSSVQYAHFYPDIHLNWAYENGHYKYSFFIEPGASSDQIRWTYGPTDHVKLSKGRLLLKTELGECIEEVPYAYQEIKGRRVAIDCEYIERSPGIFTYKLGHYDPDLPLVIDPVLVFATYNGATSDNFGMSATYGHDGSAYAAGMVYGNNFPLPSLASYDISSNFTTIAGNYGITDVFVTRYNPTGSTMMWSTFLGGGDNFQGTETAHSLICDSLNNIYLMGATSSIDFPTSAGAFQATHGGGTPNTNFYFNGVYFGAQGTDLYLAKLSANGQNLLGATYVGGADNDGVNYRSVSLPYNSVAAYDSLTTNYGDQFRGELYLDHAGSILVASCTRSANFPMQSPFQAAKAAGQDAVVFRVNPSFNALQFSSFYGGNKDDAAYSIKTDTLGALVFAGGTCSTNLAGTTGGYQSAFNGGKTDGFVVKLNPTGTIIQKASYVGATYYDQAFFVEIDRNNNIYLLGQSVGAVFPVNNALYSNPGSSQFVLKLNPNLTANLASTVIGNGSSGINISPAAFLVDICGNIYISGWGANILQSAPLVNMPISANAFQTSSTGFDFYLMVLKQNFAGLLYATYMGGPVSHEHVDGGTSRFDKNGVVYQSVCGGCGGHSDFPTPPGVWSNQNNSNNCNNLVFKFDFQLIPTAQFTSSNLVGCADLSVTFQNTSTQGDAYLWDFGNGDTTSTVFNPTVTYQTPGTYEVSLQVTDSVCLITDTALIQLQVLSPVQLNLTDTISLCSNSPYVLTAFTNGTASQFIWSVQANLSSPLNNLSDSSIVVNQAQWYYCQASNGYCSVLDSVYVAFGVPLQASFTLPDTLACAPFSIQIDNNSSTTTSWLWDFGNGQLDSTTFSPNLTYTVPGTYTIQLFIQDSICQGAAQSSVQVLVGPALNVSASPDIVLCSSIDTTLQATISGTATSLIWSSSASFNDTLNVANASTLVLTAPQTGWYYVQALSAYCSRTDSVLISVLDESIAIEAPSTVCAQTPVILQVTSASNMQSITWTPAASFIGSNTSASVTAQLASSQELYVEVQTPEGCVLTDSVFISTVFIDPSSVIASATPTVILPNASTTLFGAPSGYSSYSWSPSATLQDPTSQNTLATPEQTTIYTLTVSDGICFASDTVLVRVFDVICGAPYVFVPNAFSPNKDGHNDKLYVRGPFIKSFVFRVYDRWGELVWETSDINEGWDGTFRGKLLDPDVYDYYLQVTCYGELESILKGNVTLTR
ncbi:MAG: hypothetical protein RLZZ301_1303 [Bacteroidota bacterium]|jgi:gliding motility-associated-like protein